MTMDDNWVKHVSSRRGRSYFFNTKTGESRWENPKDICTSSQKSSSNEEQKCKSSSSESRITSSSRDSCTTQKMQRQDSCKRSCHASAKPQRTSPHRGSKRSLSSTNTENTRTEAKKRATTSEMSKSETADLSQKRRSSRSRTGSVSASDKRSGQSEMQERQGRCLRSKSSTSVIQDPDATSIPKRKAKKKSKKKKSKKKCIVTTDRESQEVQVIGQKEDEKRQGSLSIYKPCNAGKQTGKAFESPKDGFANEVRPVEDSKVAQRSISKLKIPKYSKELCKHSAEENISLASTSTGTVKDDKTFTKERSFKSSDKSGSNKNKPETCNREGNLPLKNSSHSTITHQTGGSFHTSNCDSNKDASQTQGDLSRDEDFEMEVDIPTWALGEAGETTLDESVGSSAHLPSRQEITSAAQPASPSLVREEESQMEVDFPSVTEGKLLVIVDTNVLINNFPFVGKIKGMTIEGLGEILLVIPWMVMQELDGLKGPSGAPASHVSVSARKALDFLHKNRGDPSIRGQSYHHFSKKTLKSRHDNSDDKILQYCLQCKKKYDKNLVVMLTNDKNLAVKASFSGIPSSGYSNFEEDIRKQVALRSEFSFSSDDTDHEATSPDILTSGRTPRASNRKGTLPSVSSSSDLFSEINVGGLRTGKDIVSTTDEVAGEASGGGSQRMNSLPSDTKNLPLKPLLPLSDTSAGKRKTDACTPAGSPQVRGESRQHEVGFTRQMMLSLKLALAVVLRQEMVEAYTNHWLEIIHKKPPWSLVDILQCFKKHYVAVFGLLLGRQRDEDVSKLITIIRAVGEDESFDSSQRDRFHSLAVWLLEILSKNPKYEAVCSNSREDLQKVYKSWQSVEQDSAHLQAQDPSQTNDTAQKGEEMVISPATATPVSSHCSVQGAIRDANFQWDRGADGGSKREDCGDRGMAQCGLADIAFRVLSIFEAIWTLLQSHRDLVTSSFQYLSAGASPEGVPAREESLFQLGVVIPLVKHIIDSLQRLLLSSDSMGMLLCIPVVESVHAFARTLKANIDVSIMRPEVLERFVSVAENRERLAVGTEQLSELLQQLKECVATLSRF